MKIENITQASNELKELREITNTTYSEVAEKTDETRIAVTNMINEGIGQLRIYIKVRNYLDEKKRKMKKGGLI